MALIGQRRILELAAGDQRMLAEGIKRCHELAVQNGVSDTRDAFDALKVPGNAVMFPGFP